MTVLHLDGSGSECDSFMTLAGLDQAVMDALPQAVYLCAGDGRVVRFNQQAVDLWGRTPRQGAAEERFCGSFRLYRTDGSPLPHDQCPMARSLQTGESFHNQEVVVEQPGGRQLTVLVNIAAFRDNKGKVNGAVNCFHDITGRKRDEDWQRLLIEEFSHRIKTTLETVHSVAVNTARDAGTVEEFMSRFELRLLALNQAHDLAGNDQPAAAKLHEVLAQQLEPFGGGNNPRVRFDGPEIELEPRSALALRLVFHELAVNATKYGPLSGGHGQIWIKWDLLSVSEGEHTLTLQWIEVGGPQVETSPRNGLGTRLIKRTITSELGGQMNLHFEPSGLQLWMSIPIRS